MTAVFRKSRPSLALRTGVAMAVVVAALMGGGCQGPGHREARENGGEGREVASGGGGAGGGAQRSVGTSSYRHYRLNIEPVGVVPHAGPDLPAISGDGRWMAWVETDEAANELAGRVARERDALLGSSVHVARVDALQRARRVAGDAAWPAFCAADERLVVVARDETGQQRLILHELATGHAQVIAPGLRHMQHPRFSPDGSMLAFSAHAPDHVRRRIYALKLDTRSLTAAPVPAALADAEHLAPHWLDDEAVLFFAAGDAAVQLVVWSPGDDAAEAVRVVGRLELQRAGPAALRDALAGLTQPLDPSRRYLAWHDAAGDRVVVMDMQAGAVSPLDEGTHALAWMDDASLLASDGRDVLLYELPRPGSGRRLIGGRWLPRWGSWERGAALLLGPGPAGELELVRLRIQRQ